MPAAVERALIEKLGWRNRPNPVDLYAAVYEVLEAMQVQVDRGDGGLRSIGRRRPAGANAPGTMTRAVVSDTHRGSGTVYARATKSVAH